MPPLITVPPINIAVEVAAVPPTEVWADDGMLPPVYTVPTLTFSILISRTGTAPSTIRSVLSFLLSFLKASISSRAAEGVSTGAAYTPASPAENDLSDRIVSLTITPPPTVLPASSRPAAACGFSPQLLSRL